MIGKAKRKFEIIATFNRYKNTLDDLSDSLNIRSPDQPESSNWLELIDKEIENARRLRSALLDFLKKDCLDKNVSVMLLQIAPKTQDS